MAELRIPTMCNRPAGPATVATHAARVEHPATRRRPERRVLRCFLAQTFQSPLFSRVSSIVHAGEYPSAIVLPFG
jgi:hypothetical protein